jgi:hypothetical protein
MVTEAAARFERELLRPAIRALEVGDWNNASALFKGDQIAGDRSDAAYLVVIGRTIAGAMGAQAAGDIQAATRQYTAAEAMLPPGLTHTTSHGRRRVALPIAEPVANGESMITRLFWRAARILWREQYLIDDLRRQLRKLAKPRDHLIEAYIQFQLEVEFSPFAWAELADRTQPDPPVTPSRSSICRRASHLRKLALPRAGDVSETVWKDIGGHRGVRARAQARLAERPLTPWADEIGLRVSVPVRFGRQRAWEYARQWKLDLDYEQLA